MRKIIIYLFLLIGVIACDTKQDVIDTGISSPYFDGNMMEYLRSDSYNWELTVKMIERAGLADLFEGRVDTLPEITFFGPKSYSILRFLLDSQYDDPSQGVFTSVEDIPVAKCREFILKYVVKGKHLKASIGYRNMDYIISDPKQDGGTVFECLGGNKVRAYLEGSSYAGVAGAGAVKLMLHSLQEGKVPMATPDIQPLNGVVHALNYGHKLGKI